MEFSPPALRRLLFRVGLFLKGLDGVLEVLGGIALAFITRGLILRAVNFLTSYEIDQSSHDFIASHMRHTANHLSLASKHFMTFYLIGHGAVKIFLVIALHRNRRWAYPTALVIFGGFVAYQFYRFTFTHSAVLIALSIFDLLVMLFIWLEYRSTQDHSSPASSPAQP